MDPVLGNFKFIKSQNESFLMEAHQYHKLRNIKVSLSTCFDLKTISELKLKAEFFNDVVKFIYSMHITKQIFQ